MIKQTVPIAEAGGKPCYPTVEFIREFNRLAAPTSTADLTAVLATLVTLQTDLTALQAQVDALEAQIATQGNTYQS